ncbi:hypothetical protein [Alkalihalobacillus sp. LMS39]|uniref:hypothetical protein n=1 Tax=Alkalihalobacillus sp. LMS39 TaxID=2924032 RepID=UPI001FB20614|nr:hypothetical protein [Alkalihalobacillus sp. LMS39]UOE93220.1 hypothetical protein MM271_18745 [Alkalihalobacillus sp. LMS39]
MQEPDLQSFWKMRGILPTHTEKVVKNKEGLDEKWVSFLKAIEQAGTSHWKDTNEKG